jgi:hypothetical protein
MSAALVLNADGPPYINFDFGVLASNAGFRLLGVSVGKTHSEVSADNKPYQNGRTA